MAQDHFERHNHHDGVVDWNFNVIFDDQRAVAEMADSYRPMLRQPYFYDPIPSRWLHATIIRIGTFDQFTMEEMLEVAEKVQRRVNMIQLPELRFGQHLMIHGNVCFRIEPEAELEKLYIIVVESLGEVVGFERVPKAPYGHFVAHASFVYSKFRDNEAETQAMLQSSNIEPAMFRIRHMPLIKQWPVNGHYEWEVVKDVIVK